MSAKEKLVHAARGRLARGDGKGPLLELGIQITQLIADARIGKESLYLAFRSRGRGDARRGVTEELIEHLEEEQLRLRADAVSVYHDRAELIAEGGGRKMIEKALVGELSSYGGVPDDGELARARERLYYLSIALCDAMTAGGDDLSATDRLVPDHRFRRHLITLHQRQRNDLLAVYREFLAAANREPVHGVDHLERVISAFIEGALVQDRIAKGHGKQFRQPAGTPGEPLSLDGEELVDAVLRIFIALSRPADGPAVDPDAVLFGKEPSTAHAAPGEVVLHRDRMDLYTTIIAAVESMSSDEALSHCALHTSGTRPRLTSQGSDFHAAVLRFSERGGSFLNIEKIDSVEDLDATVDWLRDRIASGRAITFRALIMDSPPALSPLLIGERMAFLGRENDGVIVDGVKFVDEIGRAWCKEHFDVLWSDSRSYLLASPNGLKDRGIEDARLQLQALQRHRAAIAGIAPQG